MRTGWLMRWLCNANWLAHWLGNAGCDGLQLAGYAMLAVMFTTGWR
jgi:hypothetical protein